MARRRLLSDEAWAQLRNPPTDEWSIVRHYTLSHEDLALVTRKRTDATRLGCAVLLCYLRYPGRALEAGETPPEPMLSFVAQQLGIKREALAAYGRRDTTRREHLAELMRAFGYVSFDRAMFRALVAWATPLAQGTTKPDRLVAMALDELRNRRVLLPPPAVVELAVRRARVRAERIAHRALTDGLGEECRRALDALLELEPGAATTRLAWLRATPQSPAARNILAAVARLRHVRALGLDRDRERAVPAAVFDRLADEALKITAQHLRELGGPRRHALLAAATIRLESALTDATLVMFDKLLGSLSRGAERRTEAKTLRSVRALRKHLAALTTACRAIIEAGETDHDPIAAIEQRIGWPQFVQCVVEAEVLTRPEATDSKGELLGKYKTVRSFAPALLETFTFGGGRAVASLLKALELIAAMYRTGKRTPPARPPTGFIRRAWRPFVFRGGVVDRRAYELCALAELRDRLRAGDVWVEGSRQFQDFERYLLPKPAFDLLRTDGPLPIEVEPDFASYIAGRREALGHELATVAALARAGQLPGVELSAGTLRIAPLRADTPIEAEALKEHAYGLLPRVKITDLLLEVDAWTGFSARFTHQRNGRPAENRTALLAAILADGINLGLTRMADTCRDVTLHQLAWVHDWHIREDTYAAALARLIDAHRVMPLARLWGAGTTSSSDGQYFRAGGHGSALAGINARHGNEPGVAFYTHLSDQFGPFHTKVIAATASEAPHVLDGLLYHQTGLRIEEHYTDTGGATDHVFGLCHLFGFRFAPRLRDLKDRRLYLLPGQQADRLFEPLIGGTVNLDHLEAHWDELLRLATSIRSGTVTASVMLKKLAAYPRQNGLAVALRELGRLERTLFTLAWFRSLDLRRRAHAGLNKGEARNALARALFFNRLGELRDRSFENQIYRASGLNLLIAAIILWNTRYLELALAELQARGRAVSHELARRIAPLGWEHISLTGDYVWTADSQPLHGQLRPLRRAPSLLAA